jgi:hypothetical protein
MAARMLASAFDSLSTAEEPAHGDLKILVDRSDVAVIVLTPCCVAQNMCRARLVALMSNALHIAHLRTHYRQLAGRKA